jgi:hypothetical protein
VIAARYGEVPVEGTVELDVQVPADSKLGTIRFFAAVQKKDSVTVTRPDGRIVEGSHQYVVRVAVPLCGARRPSVRRALRAGNRSDAGHTALTDRVASGSGRCTWRRHGFRRNTAGAELTGRSRLLPLRLMVIAREVLR